MSLSGVLRFGAVVAGGSAVVYFGKTLVSSDGLAEKIEMKEDGVPVFVPKNVNDFIREVMEEMELSDEVIDLLKTVTIENIDLEHFGTSKCKPGAYLMVPYTYFTESQKMTGVNLTPILKMYQVPEDSPEIENLKTLLYTPVNARKFKIANEIYKSNDSMYFVLGFLPILSAAVTALTLYVFKSSNVKLMRTQPRLVASASVFSYILLYFVLYRYVQKVRVYNADFQTLKLGPNYIDGALQYFQQVIHRNKLIKKLNKRAPVNDDPDSVPLFSFTEFVPISERVELYRNKKDGVNDFVKAPNPYLYAFKKLFSHVEEN
ncbi:hypothetical protein RUM43_012189 [Polyplax serrata]|uniref:Transmembrane protein 177 n=1 Tax=Polyplax serrata TaxID=468196 RepID=A0AAN8P6P7_POLSC